MILGSFRTLCTDVRLEIDYEGRNLVRKDLPGVWLIVAGNASVSRQLDKQALIHCSLLKKALEAHFSERARTVVLFRALDS